MYAACHTEIWNKRTECEPSQLVAAEGLQSFYPKDSGRNRATGRKRVGERLTDRHLANENGLQ